MSYILDALKKSERQRQLSKGPSFDAPMIAPYAESSNSYLLYGLIAASLLALGLLLSLWHTWKQDKAAQVAVADTTKLQPPAPANVTPASPQIAEPQIKSVPPALERKPLSVPPKPVVESSVKNTKPATKAPAKTLPAIAKVEAPQAVLENKPIENKVATKEIPSPQITAPQTPEKEMPTEEASASSEAAPQNKLLEIPELPSNIQQEIPEMSIAGYALSSNPKERSVGINGRLLQEGDYLKQGLRLEHISPEGLIFSYKNYHFRQSLQ